MAVNWQKALSTASQIVPRRLQPVAAFAERAAAAFQGKGIGSRSLSAEVRALFSRVVGQDLTVFDVGANRGNWSRVALKRYGARIGHLVVFEPAKTHRLSLAHVPLDGRCEGTFEHVESAVADVNGPATLYSDFDGSGLASLTKRRLSHFDVSADTEECVTTVTLDSFVKQRHIGRIDLIKLDIEGHEFAALRGAIGLLQSHAIGALAFEFGGCNIDTRTFFQDFWYLLTPLGYRIGRILPDGRVDEITRYRESLEFFATTNYVAWITQP